MLAEVVQCHIIRASSVEAEVDIMSYSWMYNSLEIRCIRKEKILGGLLENTNTVAPTDCKIKFSSYYLEDISPEAQIPPKVRVSLP